MSVNDSTGKVNLLTVRKAFMTARYAMKMTMPPSKMVKRMLLRDNFFDTAEICHALFDIKLFKTVSAAKVKFVVGFLWFRLS